MAYYVGTIFFFVFDVIKRKFKQLWSIFYQYQQSEKLHLSSYHWTQTKPRHILIESHALT